MKKKEAKKELPFSEDYLFMSWRYCIGRHTIAAHCHASTIAQDAYGKLKQRKEVNSIRKILTEKFTIVFM